MKAKQLLQTLAGRVPQGPGAGPEWGSRPYSARVHKEQEQAALAMRKLSLDVSTSGNITRLSECFKLSECSHLSSFF